MRATIRRARTTTVINVVQLLERVEAYGYAVVVLGGVPNLKPGPDPAKIPTPLMDALKKYRGEIVKYLTQCRECGRDVGCPEDRERLKGLNPFCREVGCPFRRGNDS
jgi:hypothetical protein